MCSEMSESTGVCAADIVSTLHALSILQCENDRYTILVQLPVLVFVTVVVEEKYTLCWLICQSYFTGACFFSVL